MADYMKVNGPHYAIDYKVVRNGNSVRELPETEWADWDDNGDLLFAREGQLWRLAGGEHDSADAVALIDFSGDAFEEIVAPAAATYWKG